MPSFVATLKRYAAAVFVAVVVSGTAVATTSVVSPAPAEAGVFKKAKKGTKLIGRGARWAEKKLAKKGKVGKVLSRGFGGIRKGANKLNRGIGKVQKGAKRGFNKVCKRKCQKVAKGVRKVGKGFAKLKRKAEDKCEKYGRNSRACKVAMDALQFASPI